jgi:hypothetical protein
MGLGCAIPVSSKKLRGPRKRRVIGQIETAASLNSIRHLRYRVNQKPARPEVEAIEAPTGYSGIKSLRHDRDSISGEFRACNTRAVVAEDNFASGNLSVSRAVLSRVPKSSPAARCAACFAFFLEYSRFTNAVSTSCTKSGSAMDSGV